MFRVRTTAAWVQLGIDEDVPIAPVNTPHTLHADSQFRDRFSWLPAGRLGADELPFPVKVVGADPVVPARAPAVGEHTDAVLREVLVYEDAHIDTLRADGALG